MAAAERFMMAVALMWDLARHGDFEHLSALQYAEQYSTIAAWEILSAHSLTARLYFPPTVVYHSSETLEGGPMIASCSKPARVVPKTRRMAGGVQRNRG
jgi:hypothetical protein